jgi:hypothetical protein
MTRTSFFMNPTHLKELADLGKSTGQSTSSLVRVAILQYIRRESRKAITQTVIRGSARREGLGE